MADQEDSARGAPADDTLSGHMIDRRWRVVRKLGGGGMGTVYEVVHYALGDERALKLIKRDIALEAGYRQRFFQEATLLRRAKHPNVVEVHDFAEDPDHGLFLVMELVRGTNLKQLLQARGRLAYGEVLQIGKQIAAALERVHHLGTVHRDIKPANILIEDSTGRAVVTDFGIAKDLQADETLTGTLEIVATLGYGSPEQLTGDKSALDQRTDIFSLGAVLFEMYAGKHYGGIGAVIGATPRLKYPEPPPPGFKQVVEGCLAGDPDQRIKSAADVILLLSSCEAAQQEHEARVGTEPPLIDVPMAAHGSEDPTRVVPDVSSDALTLAEAGGTKIEERPPPGAPKDGTATLQIRKAQEQKDAELQEQIEAQQRGVEAARQDCLALQQHLSRFGVSATGFTTVEALSERLQGIEEEPDLERRSAQLDGLIDALGETRAQIEAALRNAAVESLADLEKRVGHLASLGEPFAPEAEIAVLETELHQNRGVFDQGDWFAGRKLLDRSVSSVQAAEGLATSRASAVVDRALRDAEELFGRIVPLWAADREPPSSADTRAEAQALLADGRVVAARDLVARLLAEGAETLHRLEEARDEAERTRALADERRAALPSSAADDAADELRAAAEARRLGAEAERARAFGDATEHHGREAELYAEAVAAVERADARRAEEARQREEEERQRLEEERQRRRLEQVARVDEARRDLAAALEAAPSEPDFLVEEPRRRAARLVAEPPGDLEEAMSAIASSAAALSAAVQATGQYSAASQSRAEAHDVDARVTALDLGRRELKKGRDALKAADNAFGRQRWVDAAALYADAVAELRRLEAEQLSTKEAQARRRADEESGLRRELERAAGEPVDLVGQTVERARTLLEGERPADFQAELDALAAARQAVAASIDERTAWEKATAARAEATVASGRLDGVDLRREERDAVQSPVTQANQAFATRQWSRAAELYAGVAAVCRRVEEERRRREELAQVAAAKSRAEMSRARVDAVDAVELAADAFERAERSWRAAQSGAGEDRDLPGAAAQFDDAAGIYAEIAERIERTWGDRLGRGERDLNAAIELAADAPEALVGPERATAAALLGDEVAATPRERVANFERAQLLLEDALGKRDAYNGALASQAEVGVAFATASSEGLTESDLAESAVQRRAADAAFAAREWETAARGYADAVGSIARARDDFRLRQERAAAEAARASAERAAAEGDLRAALARTEGLATELVGAAVERARQLLDGTRPAEFGAELKALVEATSEVESVAAQRPAYERVVALRADVGPLRDRLAKLERKPDRKQRKTIEQLVAPAKAERAGDWAAAAEQYAATIQALQGVADTLEIPVPPRRLPLRAIAVGVVGIAAVAVTVVEGPDLYKRLFEAPAPTTSKTTAPVPPAVRPPEAKPAIEPPAAQGPAEPARIAAFSPDKTDLPLREGGKQPFSIEVAGGEAGSPPVVQWLLDGQKVKEGAKEWEYVPDFTAAGNHTVVASIGDDKDQKWNLRVEDVNRTPVVETIPAAGKIDAKLNEVLKVQATATDADPDDTLSYKWTLDGRPVGKNEPSYQMKVDGPHKLALATTDGKSAVTSSFDVSPPPPSVLALEVTPKQAEALAFSSSQPFSLSVPPGVPKAGLQVAWAVDGQKVSDGFAYTFKADDPKYVRGNPVKLSVRASDAEGGKFDYDWKVNVLPPAKPEIDAGRTQPPAGTVDAEAGSPVTFEVAANKPVASQNLTYTFSVDGKEAQRGLQSTFRLTPKEGDTPTVTAKIEDNFKQSSPSLAWKVRLKEVASGAVAKQWLSDYETAFRNGDAQRIGELRGLGADAVTRLGEIIRQQKNRKVTFSGDKVESLGGNQARVSYENSVTFTDPSGSAQAVNSRCIHLLDLRNGRLVDTATSPCTQR